MNLWERSTEGIREVKVSLASIKSLEGCTLRTDRGNIQLADESLAVAQRQLWLHRRAMNSLKIYSTQYSNSTGCHYARIAPDFWQHVDCNAEISRPIGDFYLTREDLLADHLPYLLRNGWLKYFAIEPASPVKLQRGKDQNEVWEMRNSELGIVAIGSTSEACRENFLRELTTEFGATVFIGQKKD